MNNAEKQPRSRVAVLGAGAFGLAVADYLARQGNSVIVWDRDQDVLGRLRSGQSVDRPKGLIVSPSVEYADDISAAVNGAAWIVCAVPSFAVADITSALVPLKWSFPGAVFVNCSKGIEQDTLRLPSDVFAQVIGRREDIRYAVLAGPSHAEEVSRDIPTAVVAAAPNPEDAEKLQQLFSSQTFRVYTQPDYRGAELGGALKNVMAIAVGISHGKGFGDNTKAMLLTRALAEMSRLATAMGSSRDTVMGLSGLGDLIVTTMSEHSRNRQFGVYLASGLYVTDALEKVGAVVEGYKTAKSVYELSRKYRVEMPLVKTIYGVLYDDLTIDEAIAQLLGRDLKREEMR